MQIRRLELDGVVEVIPKKYTDDRGFFSETWKKGALADAGIVVDFIQDNHSRSAATGTLRGLHYQKPPYAQAKLVRVLQGAIFDVAVDIRRGSPTFGRWVGLELSSARWNQVFIPAGFAHGFVTLLPDTEVVYKVDAAYSPEHDRSIRYDDPSIAVAWPPHPEPFQLSEKDRKAPTLAESDTGFVYP